MQYDVQYLGAAASVTTRSERRGKHRVAVRTYDRYRSIVRLHLTPSLGALKIEQLRPANIEAALTQWINGTRHDKEPGKLSPRSVKHIFDTLRAACRWGVRMEMLVRNPADHVSPPKAQQPEMKTIDAIGFGALLEAAADSELRIPIVVLLGTGLRRGELLGLKWSDVDLDSRKLSVRRSIELVNGERREKAPKTARSARRLALSSFVVDALREQRRRQDSRNELIGRDFNDSDYVFDRPDGSLWKPDSFSWAFADLVRRAGLPKIRLHDLRHSYATLSLAAGNDLKTISTSLGHSTISITANIYMHAVDSLGQEHADRLDSMLGPTASASRNRSTANRETVSVQFPCNPAGGQTKNPAYSEVFLVAPAGFEPDSRLPPLTENHENALFFEIRIPPGPAHWRPFSARW